MVRVACAAINSAIAAAQDSVAALGAGSPAPDCVPVATAKAGAGITARVAASIETSRPGVGA